jgi:hypothetical protein
VPRSVPSAPRVSRTMKVTTGVERFSLTRRTLARPRQPGVIAL